MRQDPDEERIRQKAHELWVAEGRPHGRDRDHWDEAREIIAIQDSQAATLLPRNTGAEEPVESSEVAANFGDVPGLRDQGRDDLTDVARENAGSGEDPLPSMTATPTMTSEEITGVAKASAPPQAPPTRAAPKAEAKEARRDVSPRADKAPSGKRKK